MNEPSPSQRPDRADPLGHLARALYRERRLRDRFVEADLLGEGPWDILLDLYASTAEGYRICISSACAAACVPNTTALRQIKRLEDLNLIRRIKDELDARRYYVVLTEEGEKVLRNYLLELSERRRAGLVIG